MAKMSDAGISHLKAFEGLSLAAYPDGPGYSIGYGHHGPDVTPGMEITERQADELLRRDLDKFERGVEDLLELAANQEEFDSMIALAFNIGLGAFRDSTLLDHHNAGRHKDAAEEFTRWTKSGGTELPGLVKRREKEAAMYRAGGRV